MLQKCCCCVSLSKGAVVLGYIGLSLSSICLVTGIVSFINLDSYILQTYKVPSEDVFLYYKTAGLIFLTLFTAVSFLNLICCVFLIVGALQDKRLYFVPWLLLSLFYLTIHIGLIVHFAVNGKFHSVFSTVVTSIFLVINLYSLICVFSLYKLLLLKEVNYPAFLRKTGKSQINYETTYVPVP